MKWSVMIVAAALFVMASASSWAGGSCCRDSKKSEAKMSDCSSALSGIDLTAEQEAKIAEIQATCKAAGESKEACKTAYKEIRSVLTDDQAAQLDAKHGKKSKRSGSCD